MVQGNQATTVPVRLVDVDVHPAPQSGEELLDYIPEPWRSRRWPAKVLDAVGSPIYVAPNEAQRGDSYPCSGGPPCSDPDFTQRQLLEGAGVDLAILIPLTARPVANPEHEAAVCAATNTWLHETWLTRYNLHGRYRGTIRVCSSDTELAVREIERWAGNDRFVQVMLIPYTSSPLGTPQYRPIFETAARHGLPVSIHVNRGPGAKLLTPVGFASYFIEHHALYPLIYAAHLTSLIFEGVFDSIPALKLILIEGGVSWVVPLSWRLDRHYLELKSEVTSLHRLPSQVIRDQVRFSTQPLEEPPDPRHLTTLLDSTFGPDLLMFATDYPHWDFDDPGWALRRFPPEWRRAIAAGNAIDLYRLPVRRARAPLAVEAL